MESRKQIGEGAVLNFGASGKVTDCTIIGVHHSVDKVHYDVLVHIGEGDTKIENVDSAFVE